MLFKSHAFNTFVFNQGNDEAWCDVWLKLQKQQTKNATIYKECMVHIQWVWVGCSAVKKEK